MVDTILYTLQGIWRRRTRNKFTIISIAVGVAAVVLMSCIGEIGQQLINQELNRLGLGSLIVQTNQNVLQADLTQAELEMIRKSGLAESATPVLME